MSHLPIIVIRFIFTSLLISCRASRWCWYYTITKW